MIGANSCRCRRCNKLLSYEERIKITAHEFIKDNQVSGSLGRTVDSINLCRVCYIRYNEFMINFF